MALILTLKLDNPDPKPDPSPEPDAAQASEYKPRIGRNQGAAKDAPVADDDEDDEVDDADRGDGTHEYECTKCGYIMFPAAGREVQRARSLTPTLTPTLDPTLITPTLTPTPTPTPLPLQFKFYGDDFKCPTCGAGKDSFIDNGVVEV